ncbi:MAG: leucine-rich repeat protein [Prevotella sp.]|nr:leucine-rich repeat protein [Prevotella sp.]
MKRALLMCGYLLLIVIQMQAQEFFSTYEGQIFYFKAEPSGNNTVALSYNKKAKFKSSVCKIPSTVTNKGVQYTVTKIAEKTFKNNKYLVEVYIPSSVIEIGEKAFNDCKNLVNVFFSEGLQRIGEEAFSESPVQEVILPHSLQVIGERAFFYHDAFLSGIRLLSPITNVIIPSTKIKTLYVPRTVVQIGDHAFNTFRNGVGVWTTSKMEVMSLPDWVTADMAGKLGIHKDSYNYYISRKNAGTLPDISQLRNNSPIQSNRDVATQSVPDSNVQQVSEQPRDVYVQQHQNQVIPQQSPMQKEVNNVPNTAPSPRQFSDVDINIPQSQEVSENTFAIIIANENYQNEVDVQYALNDGRIFKEYCEKTLGVPQENIHYKENATLNNIIAEVDWLNKVAMVFDGEARVIFYYAGHGVPDESNRDAYLLPVDGLGSNVATGYKMSSLYDTLGKMKTKNVSIFMDACFSGAQRGNGMLASARGIAIKVKPSAPHGPMVVMSAAQGDETAYPYKEKGHGLFTYFLLKKLQESKGNCNMEDLANFVKTQVSRRAIIVNGKPQTPTINVSTTIASQWKEMRLK